MAGKDDCKCPPAGLPGWMGTFADLMSLLMCFFVLLLSFSEMDAMKFKRLAGSLKMAFGVQAQVRAVDPPKGTSVVAREFSPGRPEPTPINEIWQKTDSNLDPTLDFECSQEIDAEQGRRDDEAGIQTQLQAKQRDDIRAKLEELVKQTQQDAMELAQALMTQIANGEVEIETRGRKIIVRIKEQGSFASGSAELAPEYRDVLSNVGDVLVDQPGAISIQGHTDDVPINTARFRSNWDLSSARASSVAMELLRSKRLSPLRMAVTGLADTRPLVANNSSANRAENRRVEIVIQQGLGDVAQADVDLLRRDAPDVLRDLEIESRPRFELSPRDVF